MNYITPIKSFLESASSSIKNNAGRLADGARKLSSEAIEKISSSNLYNKFRDYCYPPVQPPSFLESGKKYLLNVASAPTGLSFLGHSVTVGEATCATVAAVVLGSIVFSRLNQTKKNESLPLVNPETTETTVDPVKEQQFANSQLRLDRFVP